MGNLSENYDRSEFECECGCKFDTVDAELIKVLQSLSDYFGTSVFISGGNRCKTHNDRIQLKYNPNYKIGSSKSQHMFGKAADIKVKYVEPKQVYDYLHEMYPNMYGIGLYGNRVHIDVRSRYAARWTA